MLSLTLGFIFVSIFALFLGTQVVIYRKQARRLQERLNTETLVGNMARFDWSYLAKGESGDLELERAWLRKAQEVYGVFCVKQHDYGPDNIAVGGVKGLALRIGDKVSRLWELTGLRTGEVKVAKVAEARRDIGIDLADYGMIFMMVEDGDWPVKDIERAFGPIGVLLAAESIYQSLSAEEKAELALELTNSDFLTVIKNRIQRQVPLLK